MSSFLSIIFCQQMVWALARLRSSNCLFLGAGGGYTAGDTDGSATHTLTAAESGLPSHSHTQRGGGFNGSVGIEAGSNLNTSLGETGTTGGTNASQAHNNMPPYIVVYMFKRIAD